MAGATVASKSVPVPAATAHAQNAKAATAKSAGPAQTSSHAVVDKAVRSSVNSARAALPASNGPTKPGAPRPIPARETRQQQQTREAADHRDVRAAQLVREADEHQKARAEQEAREAAEHAKARAEQQAAENLTHHNAQAAQPGNTAVSPGNAASAAKERSGAPRASARTPVPRPIPAHETRQQQQAREAADHRDVRAAQLLREAEEHWQVAAQAGHPQPAPPSPPVAIHRPSDTNVPDKSVPRGAGGKAPGPAAPVRAAGTSSSPLGNPDLVRRLGRPVDHHFNAYGAELADNKAKINAALDHAGATLNEKAFVMGMAMIETTTMAGHDTSKDTPRNIADGSVNTSAFNMNLAMIEGARKYGGTLSGVPGYDRNIDLNDPKNLNEAVKVFLGGMRTHGTEAWVAGHRGGFPAAQRQLDAGTAITSDADREYFQKFYDVAATNYEAILKDPRLLTNDMRVDYTPDLIPPNG